MSSSLRLFRNTPSLDREDSYSKLKLPHVIRRNTFFTLDRVFCLFTLRRILLTFLFFVYTFLLLYISGSYALECSSKFPREGKVSYRILSSVRSELIESSKRLEEVNAVIDDLNRRIPEQQQELVSIHDEIETAQRSLLELRDRKNVRIYLPHSPLLADSLPRKAEVRAVTPVPSFEQVFDYSRCSISSFLPVYLYPLSPSTDDVIGDYHREFSRQANLVHNPEAACLFIYIVNGTVLHQLLAPKGQNHLIINHGKKVIAAPDHAMVIQMERTGRIGDESLHLNVPSSNDNLWQQLAPLLPYSRTNILFFLIEEESEFLSNQLDEDLVRIQNSADNSSDVISVSRCKHRTAHRICQEADKRDEIMRSSTFCVLAPSPRFAVFFWESLHAGCIPVVLSMDQPLPFQDLLDWRLASYRIPLARLPEVHFIVRSFDISDVLEMRRRGRLFFETYLADRTVLTKSILSALSHRIGVPLRQQSLAVAKPLFNASFTAPILTPVNVLPFDDEYLGPLEAPIDSPSFLYNFSLLQMYSHNVWNGLGDVSSSPEFVIDSFDLPTDAQFLPDSNIGFRPIAPGSGAEFSKALGGNRAREQFTVVMLTYNRDAVLASSLERLHRLPYLNKIVVVWNNIDREPVGAWPRLHVPVEFVRVSKNSLNNRFIPWDRIRTEAVLSLDDDIDLKHHEIVFAFRVWRENRDRLVGFPARHHARFGDGMYYNSNHTCQLSIILTGAAFLHKEYLSSYSYRMPAAIRSHIDEVMNCEDIAMNFHISHLTRKPPIKTTSKWTLRCPTCSEALSQDESHFQERHECIRLFTRIYGYNPLKFSQFRADSVLFKTRLPADKQKCFKYV